MKMVLGHVRSDHQLEQKNTNAIDQADCKNPFGCLVPAGVNVISEQSDISNQAPYTPEGNQLPGSKKSPEKFVEVVLIRKPEIINDDHHQHGCNESQYESQF